MSSLSLPPDQALTHQDAAQEAALKAAREPWLHGREALHEALARLSQDALALSEADEHNPVREVIPPSEVEERLRLALPTQGRDLHDVLDHVRELLLASPTTSGARFFNQLFAGRDPIGAPVDMLASLANHSMYTYKVAGPLVLLEEGLLKALRERVGYPNGEGGGIFTPGGSLSNLAAMLCARDHLAPNAREEGVPQGLRVYCSEEAHYSVRKGAGVVGFGRNSVVAIESDERGQMISARLREQVRADREAGLRPMMIIGTAGTTVLGAFDPFHELADIAEEEGLWFHIDGAFGGTALWSERLQERCAGAERAHSFTWDAHKAMGMPLTCSALLTRDPHASARALSESASYLFQGDDAPLNPGTRSLQCGRRDDALKLWAAWQYHGSEGWRARTERLYDLALALAALIKRRPSLKLLMSPSFLTVSFERVGADSVAICEALRVERRALVGYAMVKGRAVIRAAVLNPELTLTDLETLLDEIEEVAPRCPAPTTSPDVEPLR